MAQDYMSIESILAIDCGSTLTRALLMDLVDGEYRLVARGEAPSTLEAPWNDVMASVRQALDQLADVTGWRLLDDRGQIISPEHQDGGVDAVVVISGASEPLHLMMIGVMQDVSLASARRALSTSHVVVDGIVSLDRRADSTHSVNDDVEGQVRLIQELKPDAIVIVGGVDGGASRPVLRSAEAVALACSALPEASRPPVIYAGNTEL